MIIMKQSVTGRRLFVRPRRLPANENKAKTDELEDTLLTTVGNRWRTDIDAFPHILAQWA